MLQGRLEFQRTQKAAAQMRATMGIMYEAIKLDYRCARPFISATWRRATVLCNLHLFECATVITEY